MGDVALLTGKRADGEVRRMNGLGWRWLSASFSVAITVMASSSLARGPALKRQEWLGCVAVR